MGDDEKQKYNDLAAARNKKPDRPAAEAAVRLKTFNEIETTIETPAAVNKQERVCFITQLQSQAVFYLLRAMALARIFISVAPAVESQL